MRSLSILGSTGSIGRSSLDVVEAFPDRFRVVALAAGRSLDRLAEQVARFKPRLVSIDSPDDVSRLERLLPAGLSCRVVAGADGLAEAATHPDADTVVGGSGRRPGPALRAGRDSRRQTARARQQGAPGRRGSAHPRRGRSDRGRDHPRRLRAQRDPPGDALRAARGGPPSGPDRLGRTVPGTAAGELRRDHGGGCPGPPDLEDGPQDHDRFRHDDEQGPGGHRGALPLRTSRRAHRGRHPSRNR